MAMANGNGKWHPKQLMANGNQVSGKWDHGMLTSRIILFLDQLLIRIDFKIPSSSSLNSLNPIGVSTIVHPVGGSNLMWWSGGGGAAGHGGCWLVVGGGAAMVVASCCGGPTFGSGSGSMLQYRMTPTACVALSNLPRVKHTVPAPCFPLRPFPSTLPDLASPPPQSPPRPYHT
jgi:hypothetical protein